MPKDLRKGIMMLNKYYFLLAALLTLSLCCCKHPDDFAFSGKVVDIEFCSTGGDVGYAIQLTSPDTLGGSYLTSNGDTYDNVVVAWQSPRPIHINDTVAGRMYMDDKYSKAYCNYYTSYRESRGYVTECILTETKIQEN